MMYDNMIELRSRLLKINAGTVLDVACGKGEFLMFALRSFSSYRMAVGIDDNIESLSQARRNLYEYPVSFVVGSALSMPFLDESFSTVLLSNALHHISDHEKLFHEMIRICRPDGLIIINEMISDTKSEYQESHKLYHHYITELDNLLGYYHRETYSEKELTNLLRELNLKVDEYFVHEDDEKGQLNADEIDAMTEKMKKKVSLLKNNDSYYLYLNKARDIEKKIRKSGVHRPKHMTFIIRPAMQ
ncbi:MAG: class I SAM-dependent methyltransferase [Bacteroidales bacterium]|nr:class I SAM-dependent methyltransferase [Bacteroidales bacterium]MBN2763788.1 class I SAM-dependent methyltransferase [Bacteroidales bacterium]